MLVCEKLLLAPCPNVSEVMVRFKLPVLVMVVVFDAFKGLIVSAPAFTSSLTTFVFRSVT